MSEDTRKSLQHNVRHSCISGFDNFNEMKEVDSKNLNEFYGSRCFLAGWGAANKDNVIFYRKEFILTFFRKSVV